MIRQALLVVAALVAPTTARTADDKPLDLIKGAWITQGGGANLEALMKARELGFPIAERGGDIAKLKIDGDKWELTGGKKTFAGKWTAKAGTKHHEIDLVIERDGKEEGKLLGLIVDFKNGTWQLAVNLPGAPRPESSDKAALRYVWKAAK